MSQREMRDFANGVSFTHTRDIHWASSAHLWGGRNARGLYILLGAREAPSHCISGVRKQPGSFSRGHSHITRAFVPQ